MDASDPPNTFALHQTVYAVNPKYRDGTRLRVAPDAQSAFNGVWVPNDSAVEISQLCGSFARVRKVSDRSESGFIRVRNLSAQQRVPGVTRGIVSNEIVTPDPEYVRGMRIYGVGILDDPVSGSKFGKGLQHLTSSHWLMSMSEFVAAHFSQLQGFVLYAQRASEAFPGFDLRYFVNCASQLLSRAEIAGLRGADAVESWLAGTFLVMAAAEVDAFPFRKYSGPERQAQRAAFYDAFRSPPAGPGTVPVEPNDAGVLGSLAVRPARRDLLPPVALERLGLNNELSALKYTDPEQPLREGFLLSKRIDSAKRHLEAVLMGKTDEDHIIHLLWNCMAIYHVSVVFPAKNDLIDFSHGSSVPGGRGGGGKGYEPVSSLEKILTGHAESTALKLDWNEGAIPVPATVSRALQREAGNASLLRWYPQLGGGLDLRRDIAGYAGCIPENLLVTNGSDDALVLICQALLHGPNATCLAPTPSYEHMMVNVECTGARLIRLDASDPFAPCTEELEQGLARHRPTVVYLVSPNNPTGVQVDPEFVRRCASLYPETVFVCDEAYFEFADRSKSCVPLATSLSNVIVTRTFSKAFCLASLRIGYLVAHPNVIERLRVNYNPKSVNHFAIVAAREALKAFDLHYAPYIAETNAARRAFVASLQSRGVDARSGGHGNFVCVNCGSKERCAALCDGLEQEGIFVRNVSARFPGFVRITIGVTDMKRVEDAVVAKLQVPIL